MDTDSRRPAPDARRRVQSLLPSPAGLFLCCFAYLGDLPLSPHLWSSGDVFTSWLGERSTVTVRDLNRTATVANRGPPIPGRGPESGV